MPKCSRLMETMLRISSRVPSTGSSTKSWSGSGLLDDAVSCPPALMSPMNSVSTCQCGCAEVEGALENRVNVGRNLTPFRRLKTDPLVGHQAASSVGTLPRSRSLSR